MDGRHHPSLSTSSSTSAIDLTGTPAGIGSSTPSSPALVTSEDKSSFARRRTSWGRVEAGQDPLQFTPTNSHAPPITTSTSSSTKMNWDDDPFYSPTDEDIVMQHHFRSAAIRSGVYSSAEAGPSSASLLSSVNRSSDMYGHQDDDEAHLTSNMSRPNSSNDWHHSDGIDPERSTGTTRSRRKTVRYSTSPSPLKKTGTRLMAVSRTLRRASLRVVNFAGMGIDEHVRLADDDGDDGKARMNEDEDELKDESEDGLPDLASSLPIRGRALGFLGPKSKLRLAMFRFLTFEYVFRCSPCCAQISAHHTGGPSLVYYF